jgi:hypothetical protein
VGKDWTIGQYIEYDLLDDIWIDFIHIDLIILKHLNDSPVEVCKRQVWKESLDCKTILEIDVKQLSVHIVLIW